MNNLHIAYQFQAHHKLLVPRQNRSYVRYALEWGFFSRTGITLLPFLRLPHASHRNVGKTNYHAEATRAGDTIIKAGQKSVAQSIFSLSDYLRILNSELIL